MQRLADEGVVRYVRGEQQLGGRGGDGCPGDGHEPEPELVLDRLGRTREDEPVRDVDHRDREREEEQEQSGSLPARALA